MAGKRHQGAVHWHLMAAADGVQVRGETLPGRLDVPEPLSEARKASLVAHPRGLFRRLMPLERATPLMVVMGELKACETSATGRWVWVRHMPDSPLRVEPTTWSRIERGFAPLFEARDSDGRHELKLVLAALVRARRE